MSLTLLHSPADVLRRVLIDLGAGSDPGDGSAAPAAAWPVYAADEPGLPDNALTVYDTTPREDGRSMIDGEGFYHHGFQVRVRSRSPLVGHAKASAVRSALNESLYDRTVTLDGTRYLVHAACGTMLLFLGKEAGASKRFLFTLNGTAALRRLD